jgi:hypothetical protein
MAAEWIQCTRLDGKTIHVNLSSATTIDAIRAGATRIAFPGGSKDYIDVKEAPEELFRLRKSENAPRPSRRRRA